MRHLQTYDKHNESWRQVKTWLNLPTLLIERLFSKILNFVPNLNFKYKRVAAKIDFDQSISKNTIKDEPKKITIDEIKSDGLRNRLKFFFDDWNIYYMGDTKDPSYSKEEQSQRIWITKDELKKGDDYYGERFSHKSFNKLPQIYVVVAKHSKEHDKMYRERDIRYKNNRNNKLTKNVKEMLKRGEVFTTNTFSSDLVFWSCIEEDRFDLVEKILDSANDKQKKKLLETKISYYENLSHYSIHFTKSKEMFDFLIKEGSIFNDDILIGMKPSLLKDDMIFDKVEEDFEFYNKLKEKNYRFSTNLKNKLDYIFDSDDLGLL